MSFAGKVWRLLVGIKDGLALVFLLLFFIALFAVLSSRPSPGAVREGALLLQLDGSVVEEVSPIDPLNALLSSAVPTREYAVRDLVRAIDEAASDKRIKAIALDLSTFLGGGQVHMQDIGDALERFRQSKKPILAYAVAYSDDSLLLAAHADEIWVDPMGGTAITGPGGERLFYAGLLDRLGVKAHVFKVGTYKSAPEPYIASEMSPEARENYQQLYGALWQEWQAHVRPARPPNQQRPAPGLPGGQGRRRPTSRRRPSPRGSPTVPVRGSNGASAWRRSPARTGGTTRPAHSPSPISTPGSRRSSPRKRARRSA